VHVENAENYGSFDFKLDKKFFYATICTHLAPLVYNNILETIIKTIGHVRANIIILYIKVNSILIL